MCYNMLAVLDMGGLLVIPLWRAMYGIFELLN